jgi:hypothetical protein
LHLGVEYFSLLGKFWRLNGAGFNGMPPPEWRSTGGKGFCRRCLNIGMPFAPFECKARPPAWAFDEQPMVSDQYFFPFWRIEMSRFGRKIAAAGTSALAVVALSACTQESPDTVYEDQATDTRETESTLDDQTYANETDTTAMDTDTSTMDTQTPGMGDDTAMSAATKDEARRMATTLGVSELNEIENWKITNAGEELGEIDRLGVDRATGEILAVVGLEGVVGVNMKEVAIPLKNLTKEGDETLTTDLTMEELQQERDIDPWDDSEVLTENATQ